MNILPQLIVNSLIATSLYILISLGCNLLYGITKFFHLAYGTISLCGAYVVLFLFIIGVPFWMSIPVGIVCGGAIGCLLEKILFLRLRLKKAGNMQQLIASLGLMISLEALLSILFGSEIQSLANFSPVHIIYQVGNASITLVQIIVIISSVIIYCLTIFLLKKTAIGKATRATTDDEEVAKIIGINTNAVISTVVFYACLVGTVVTILIGFDIGLQPTLGFSLLLEGIIAAIIGGLGNVYGGILGALLLGFVENFGIIWLSGDWKYAIAFGVLIVVLIFRPKGLLPT